MLSTHWRTNLNQKSVNIPHIGHHLTPWFCFGFFHHCCSGTDGRRNGFCYIVGGKAEFNTEGLNFQTACRNPLFEIGLGQTQGSKRKSRFPDQEFSIVIFRSDKFPLKPESGFVKQDSLGHVLYIENSIGKFYQGAIVFLIQFTNSRYIFKLTHSGNHLQRPASFSNFQILETSQLPISVYRWFSQS